ncbi:MAG: hypothetical protein AAFV95_00600 [Bacteroidota bacterium]
MDDRAFTTLVNYMERIPAMEDVIATGAYETGMWWVKFSINISHPLAWQTVQELAFVANYISLEERLPTIFYPVSPPPYLNGGPTEFLSWIIETKDKDFHPGSFQEWLEGRLPNPVDDLSQWDVED